MSSMSGILGNHGARPTFTDPDTGRVYTLSYLTQKVKSAFENWLKDRARALVEEMRPIGLAPEEPGAKAEYAHRMREYERRRDRLEDDIVAARYGFHGEVALRARNTADGSIALAAILFGCTFDEMLDLSERYQTEVMGLLQQINADSAPRRKPIEGNAPAPAE